MSEYDLTCPDCGKEHPHHDAVEEALENGMRPEEVMWICENCENSIRPYRDVDEL